jgi:ABC-type nitrate/sulfonate/bicarbonate transport system ATPase subunit
METLEMPVEALNALPYSARALVVLDSEPAKSRWLEGLMGAPGKHYGLVSEDTLLAGFSVTDNLRLPFLYHGLPPGTVDADVRYLSALAGIDWHCVREKSLTEASRLERLQVSFLQAAIRRPEILFFDQLFERLGASDRLRAAKMIQAYMTLFPLRRTVYVGLIAPPVELYAATIILEQA